MGKHTKTSVKIMAIKYYETHDVSQRIVSLIFEIDERTFRNWYRLYLQGKELERINRISKSYKSMLLIY